MTNFSPLANAANSAPDDLPSGQPVNAPAGGFDNGPAKAGTPNAGTPNMAPPVAVIFEKPPTPFPTVIRGFNFETLSSYLTNYELGNYRYIVRIWDLMRKRDEHLLSVSSKRFKRVSRLDWEIVPNDSTPEATEQAEFLSDFMAGVHFKVSGDAQEKFGLQKALRHLMTALANGYAGCEIQWFPAAGIGKKSIAGNGADGGDEGDQGATVYETYPALRADLIRIRSDFFDETGGRMKLYPDAVSALALVVPDCKLLIHRADEALMIASSILFVMKQIALGQWNEFCDRFGLPGLIGTAPDGASVASKDELLKLLTNWASKVAAVLPPGYTATFANAATGMSGGIPSKDLVERCEDALSILWMGGNLSTKSQSGSGTLAGGAQRDQEIEMTEDDAEDLSETLNAQLCAPAVKFQFGQPLLCQFKFKIAQTIDLAASIAVDVALVNDLGLEIPEADVRAKYGWRKPDAKEAVIKKAPVPAGGAGGFDANGVPLPKAPSLRTESSGDGGTAFKTGGATMRAGMPALHATDALAEEHAPQGRAAMQAIFAQISDTIKNAGDMTQAELEKQITELQGKLPTAALQNAVQTVIEKAFHDGGATPGQSGDWRSQDGGVG